MTNPYGNPIRIAGVIAALLTLASCASNHPHVRHHRHATSTAP